MLILALDVGTNTGYAVLSDGELVREGVFMLIQGTQLPARGYWKHQGKLPDLVVIERPFLGEDRVRQFYAEAVANVQLDFERAGVQVRVLRSSDWKPRGRTIPIPKGVTHGSPHIRDAYRLAKWAEEKYGRVNDR